MTTLPLVFVTFPPRIIEDVAVATRDLRMSDVAQEFDYVVVGGGTAGCALAARLSEDSSRTVCLLEAGGSGKSLFIDVPGTIVMAQRSASLNWRFQSVPQAQLNGRRISVPRGRGLGGSALINGMVYFRGHPRDYDAWAARRAPRAGAIGKYCRTFRRSEHNENFAGERVPRPRRSDERSHRHAAESAQLLFL